MNQAIPVTLVTGFPGSGKTASIIALARASGLGAHLGVLMPPLDAGAVPDEGLRQVLSETFAPGCPCCTAGAPFRVGLMKLLRRALTQPLTQIIIEGGPEGHAQSTREILEGALLASHVKLTRVIAVVDARKTLLAGPNAREALDTLVTQADEVLANHWDEATGEERSACAAHLSSLNASWQAAVSGSLARN
jgi:G3E family GTPase